MIPARIIFAEIHSAIERKKKNDISVRIETTGSDQSLGVMLGLSAHCLVHGTAKMKPFQEAKKECGLTIGNGKTNILEYH